MEFKTRKIFSQPFAAAFMLLLFLWCSSPLVKAADAYNLTVGNTGSGGGDINGTVTCTIGALGGCTTPLTDGTAVTLTANPDWKSTFDAWGTACSGTGSCALTLNADTLVTVLFSPNNQAVVLGHSVIEYTTLTETYANADEGGTVAAHVYTFYEDLTLNRPISIRLYGGVGSMYLTNVGFTTLQGALEIQQGSVEVHSLIIQ